MGVITQAIDFVSGFNLYQYLLIKFIIAFPLLLRFYLPIACFLYSVVPVQKRVLASALGTMVCTIALSLWNATRNKNDKSRAALKKSNEEAAAVNKSDSSSHNKSEESLTTAQDTLS